MLLISVTYVFAVEQVGNQQPSFQVLTAKQDMTTLDQDILSVLSQPGSSATLDFRDSGGQLNIEPFSNNLTLTITDNFDVNQTVFNEATGQIVYDLQSSIISNINLYLNGDSNTITNQSGSSPSQLYLASTPQGPQIQLGYRPSLTYSAAGMENNQAVTDIRVYVINLSASTPLSLGGELPLKISCLSTQLSTETFQVSNQATSVEVFSQLNNLSGSISVPISNTPNGAIINLQLVSSNVSIEEGIA